MRYVQDHLDEDEEVFDDEVWQTEAQVARITYSSMAEEEIVDNNNNTEGREVLPSESSLDNYQINLKVGHVKREAIVDSGSPISFLDFDTATKTVQMQTGILRLSMIQNTLISKETKLKEPAL